MNGHPGNREMRVTLVGGLDRLKKEYESAARSCGVALKVFTGKESCLVDKMGSPDMAILLTAMVSHNARYDIVQRSRSLGVPVVFLHTNGISGLKQRLAGLAADREGPRKSLP
jgi:hypothetical protein